MNAEELKSLLADTLKEFGDQFDAKLDELRKELTPEPPAADEDKDKDKDPDLTVVISKALEPLVTSVETVEKNSEGFGKIIENLFDRLENIEKHLSGRQSDETEDTEPLEPKGGKLTKADKAEANAEAIQSSIAALITKAKSNGTYAKMEMK